MSTQVKHRRGTQTEIDNFTPAIGEIVVNTNKDELVLGNGVHQGGVPVSRKRNTKLNYDNLDDVITDPSLRDGYSVNIKERTNGNGGGGDWDVVLKNTVTPNSTNIIECTGVATLALVLNEEVPTIKQLGALADQTTDIMAIMTEALSNFKTVCISEGKYYCSGMVEVRGGQAVLLGNNVIVTKYASLTTNSEPLFWLKGNFAQLIGLSFSSSRIVSETNSPDGVVLVGHRTMSESHTNVNYCTVSGLRISDNVSRGRTDGSTDRCLVIQNPQFSGLTSYFHTIKDLILENANVGLELRGWANGITGGNIHGFRLGNPTAGIAAFIWARGALDNAMSDFFFHSSPDSTGLLMEQMDNTANGGSVYTPYHNSFKGMVFEQGGSYARGIVATSGASNYLEQRDNVAGGNSFSGNFLKVNVVVSNRSISTDVIQASKLKVSDTVTLVDTEVVRQDPVGGNVIFSETQFYFTGLDENTLYKVVDIEMLGTNQAVIVEIDHSSRIHGYGNGGGGGKVVYKISRTAGGTLASVVMNFRTDGSHPANVGINVNTATLALKIPNNGTTTSGHTMGGTIRIFGRRDSVYAPTFYDTPTSLVGLSVAAENLSPT